MSLTFACELAAEPLTALFADGTVIDRLRALDAGVSLGLLDLSPERAEVVRRLNAAGVPVIAWLLLPESEGYWCNADNGPRVVARYAAFQAWTADEALVWDGIGLDIEPDIALMEQLVKGAVHKIVPRLLPNLFDRERVLRAQAIYTTLVTQMHLDGYCVESYQFPFILDERRVGTTLLQRLLGIVDVAVDHEVVMLYSSMMGQAAPSILWSYGQDVATHGGGIGIGSTGGGVDLAVDFPPLTWSEFTRDLDLARQLTDDVFIFSLEGCVRRGFLDWLAKLEVPADVEAPQEAQVAMAPAVQTARRVFRGMLWVGAHPLQIAGMVMGSAALVWLLRRHPRRA